MLHPATSPPHLAGGCPGQSAPSMRRRQLARSGPPSAWWPLPTPGRPPPAARRAVTPGRAAQRCPHTRLEEGQGGGANGRAVFGVRLIRRVGSFAGAAAVQSCAGRPQPAKQPTREGCTMTNCHPQTRGSRCSAPCNWERHRCSAEHGRPRPSPSNGSVLQKLRGSRWYCVCPSMAAQRSASAAPAASAEVMPCAMARPMARRAAGGGERRRGQRRAAGSDACLRSQWQRSSAACPGPEVLSAACHGCMCSRHLVGGADASRGPASCRQLLKQQVR